MWNVYQEWSAILICDVGSARIERRSARGNTRHEKVGSIKRDTAAISGCVDDADAWICVRVRAWPGFRVKAGSNVRRDLDLRIKETNKGEGIERGGTIQRCIDSRFTLKRITALKPT
jgi:hypothetical protein